jgi:two-component system, LytTR family, sensor kinase
MNAHGGRDRRRRFPARRVGLVFAGWAVYAVLAANTILFNRQLHGEPAVPYFDLLRFKLPEALLWALLTFVVLELARRLPVTAANWWHRVPLHLLFAATFHVVGVLVMYVAHPWVRPGGPRAPLPGALVGGILFDVFIYATIVATWHAVAAHGQALRLRNELLEAELRTLRMQLQPHFLFNTLNTVSELIHRDPDLAERAVARLGDLLRWSLKTSSLGEVPLREELHALDLYLDIQRLRHGEGLTLRVDAEPAVLACGVPSLLLQPLVENAIRHGIGSARGTVSVEARREDGRVVLRVSDDGAGLAPVHREGTGLRTTRTRLRKLYGDDHVLRLAGGPRGGTTVEIVVPAREPAPAGPELERVPA